jgi:hypothetical protein
MTSYQRRLRDIKYLEQCVKELESYCFVLASLLNENKIPIKLFGHGIQGDDILTPYNNGEFSLKLLAMTERGF